MHRPQPRLPQGWDDGLPRAVPPELECLTIEVWLQQLRLPSIPVRASEGGVFQLLRHGEHGVQGAVPRVPDVHPRRLGLPQLRELKVELPLGEHRGAFQGTLHRDLVALDDVSLHRHTGSHIRQAPALQRVPDHSPALHGLQVQLRDWGHRPRESGGAGERGVAHVILLRRRLGGIEHDVADLHVLVGLQHADVQLGDHPRVGAHELPDFQRSRVG
mmetsp:Transcript_14670/g.41694  ORF Transcript_14670/g.41694 Transcript_14670/m.41694 type:complete len:216 (+) Transcript_14670:3333-3980(+)